MADLVDDNVSYVTVDDDVNQSFIDGQNNVYVDNFETRVNSLQRQLEAHMQNTNEYMQSRDLTILTQMENIEKQMQKMQNNTYQNNPNTYVGEHI